METTPGIDYGAVLSDLKRRRDDLDKAIAVMEQLIGAGAPANGGGTTVVTPTPLPLQMAGGADLQIREDAFFGMNIVSAAQKYLGMRKKPASPREIASALSAGGLPTQSDRLDNTVNSVLSRNAHGPSPIFAKVKRGTWGLRSWYPNYRSAKDDDKDED